MLVDSRGVMLGVRRVFFHSEEATNTFIQEATNTFIQEMTRVHETYIREQSRVRMLGFGISAVMFIVSAIILTFAPPEKEALAYALAGVLIIVAAGVAGFSVVRIKALGLSLGQGDSGAARVSRSGRSVRNSRIQQPSR
jgi:MFS-type transporter involved in bile tolerance (Atg22 family)